jgi:pimeloyl-ACP methyl ester carboxylesterase
MEGLHDPEEISGSGAPAPEEEMETKEYVVRGAKRFERRTSNPRGAERSVVNVQADERGFFSRLCCGRDPNADVGGPAPDEDFNADCFVKLSKGVTAYRFTEPSNATDDIADELPVIVCLHGMTNSSYMWSDVVDLLCDSEQGPQARVLVFDFYGRGRSPWSGVPVTLDVLVTQTKELLDCKCYIKRLTILTSFRVKQF